MEMVLLFVLLGLVVVGTHFGLFYVFGRMIKKSSSALSRKTEPPDENRPANEPKSQTK